MWSADYLKDASVSKSPMSQFVGISPVREKCLVAMQNASNDRIKVGLYSSYRRTSESGPSERNRQLLPLAYASRLDVKLRVTNIG